LPDDDRSRFHGDQAVPLPWERDALSWRREAQRVRDGAPIITAVGHASRRRERWRREAKRWGWRLGEREASTVPYEWRGREEWPTTSRVVAPGWDEAAGRHANVVA
jgi:hypothetical protein